MFIQRQADLSKTSKIKELIISESHDQCPTYSQTFIYTNIALTEFYNSFPGIHHFLDNLDRHLTSFLCE